MTISIKARVEELLRESLEKAKDKEKTDVEKDEEIDDIAESLNAGEFSPEIEQLIAMKESMDYWADQYVQFEALMSTPDGVVLQLDEATVGKMAKTGALSGAALGGLAGATVGGLALGPGGAVLGGTYGAIKGGIGGLLAGGAGGLLFARGAARDIQAKIDRAEKKIQKWRASGKPDDKAKAERMTKVIAEWKKQLNSVKSSGSDSRGVLRKSHQEKMVQRAAKGK